jgi:type IV secretory pathway VirB4 component
LKSLIDRFRKNKKDSEEKGEDSLSRRVSSPVELVSPDGYLLDSSYIRVGKKYCRFYVFLEYPRTVHVGWLEDIKLLGGADISVHIFPGSGREVIDRLTTKITVLTSQAMIDEEKGNIYELGVTRAAARSLEQLREDIQLNRDRLHYVTIVAGIAASSPEELERDSRILEEVLQGRSIRAREAFLRHDQAFKTVAPLGENHFDDCSRNFNNGAAVSLFPFASPEFSHKKGVFLGVNLFTGSPVIYDNFIGPPRLSNYNLGVFATSGAGKSFLVKLLSLRGALLGVRTAFIDPDGEYVLLTKKTGGTNVDIEPECSTVINPFDLEEEETEEGGAVVDLLQKAAEIKSLVGMIVEGVSRDKLTAVELSLVEDAVLEEYRERGIGRKPDSLYETGVSSGDGFYLGRKKKEMPTLGSFVARLGKKEGGSRLATIMKPFLRGGTMGIFDGQTNVELKDAPLINFNVKGIQNEFLKTYAMYVITNWIWEKFVKKDVKRKKRVVVDEAWMFMKYKDTAFFLENMARRARKRNASLTVASQSFFEFAASGEGRAVLTNLATVILMRQSPTDIDAVQETFRLSEGERSFLLSCGVGEGLLRAGKNVTALKVVSSDYEKEFIETNPNR